MTDARTWSVADLHEALDGLIEHVFGEVVWVEGELVDLSRSKAGHVYFRLVDASGDDPARRDQSPPALAVTLFDSARQQVNRYLRSQGDPIRMTDGVRVRVGGRLTTYPARSSVQLVMDRIDPAFTLGLLGQERVRLIAALTEEGLLRRNAEVTMPAVPLHVGLVTSVGSAAHADALDELRRSGIGFRVTVAHSATQGVDAVPGLVAGLAAAVGAGAEVVVVARGGGAATDLAAFDEEPVARAIALCPVPVLTGIGHETDRSVADEVAHAAHKTPTAAAASVVSVVRAAERRVADDWAAVRSGAAGRLLRADHRLTRVGQRTGATAIRHLDRRHHELERAAHRSAVAARSQLRAGTDALTATVAELDRRATRVVDRAGDRLAVLGASARVHDPAAALRRGWSVTHTADGRLVRSSADVAVGTELVTTTADGSIRSTTAATETAPATGPGPATETGVT